MKPFPQTTCAPRNNSRKSRQIPEMSKKSRQTKRLGHKWFCKRSQRKKSPRDLILKPLVRHVTIPENPDKFPKCPRNPAKPSVLDTSGFASGLKEKRVQETLSSNHLCAT